MSFYTSAFTSGKYIYYRGYDDQGQSFFRRALYRPTLYIKSSQSTSQSSPQYRTIHGHPVVPKTFDTMHDARQFVRMHKDVSGLEIHGMDNFLYPFIGDAFPEKIQYDHSLIKVGILDIEVNSSNGFPDPAIAAEEIITITLMMKDEICVFGTKPYTPSRPDVKYFQCTDERSLLQSFLGVWEGAALDVVTGWNLIAFDMLYIVQRLRRVFSLEMVKRLSPFRIIAPERVILRNSEVETYMPQGIAIIDYLSAYKKFTIQIHGQLESYSLNFVSKFELDAEKLDYSEYGTLQNFYEQNYPLFVDYNIRDCLLVGQIDDKMRLLELIYAIAFDAKVNMKDALTSVLLWDVIIHNYLLDQNIVVPPKTSPKPHEAIPGGFVKDPLLGMHHWVVSFDLASLYPHLIMQYNIGPDTFGGVDTTIGDVDSIILDNRSYGDEATAMTASGAQYRKDHPSFLNKLMVMQFELRTEYKKEMIRLKKEFEATGDKSLEPKIAALDNAQMAKKIELNSAYGSFANPYFRYFSPEVASSITLSGQLAIKWIGRDLNLVMNKVCQTTDVDYVIAIDTDSVYLNFAPALPHIVPDYSPDMSKGKITDEIDRVTRDLFQPLIDKSYSRLAKKMSAYSQRMKMKREIIADKAIWTAKKRYIAHVLDSEGVRYKEPDLKMMGIEAIRSSTPHAARDAIEECLSLIMEKGESEVIEYIEKTRAKFMTLKFEDIAFPRSVNGIVKYTDRVRGYASKTPIHTKGAILYNREVLKRGLEKTVRLITDGDKIRFSYLILPNPIHDTVISVPDELPPFLELDDYIDRTKQFEKGFLEPIDAILTIIGWKTTEYNTLEAFIR